MTHFPNIALAQINPTVGDIAGNCKKILEFYERSCAQGAELVVFPELCVIGYPPEDLVLAPAFRKAAMDALRELAAHTKNKAAMIVGSVWDNALVLPDHKEVYNAAILLDEGRIQHIQPKKHLPNYGIFDEKRLFDAGEPETIAWRGHALGVMVCEDIWSDDVAAAHKAQGAEMLIVINASPFEEGKIAQRKKLVSDAARKTGLPVLYVNMIGGQDDIVFDGGSFVIDPSGLEMGACRYGGMEPVVRAAEFAEELLVGQVNGEWWRVEGDKKIAFTSHQPLATSHQLWSAMKLGLSDYVRKNGFTDVLLGLSGGIDSAITAALAVDALGASHVRGVLLPSPYTSQDSTDDALETAKLLGIKTDTIAITPAMQAMQKTLDPIFSPSTIHHPPFTWMEDVSIGGNIQARIRGQILMAMSNKTGAMLLSTGNKSETAVGYTTLYGDMCGGYNVLKDLYKTQVYELANWRNAQARVIPERSITKAPTAELKPGQLDQDQLPPYETLDAILALHIEQKHSVTEIIAQGFAQEVVEKIVRLVRINEYKRRQSCPGVKLSPMLFGKDRRYPLTNGFTDA